MALRTMGQLLCGAFILIICAAAWVGAATNATGDNFDVEALALGNFSHTLGAFGLSNIEPGANETTTDADNELENDDSDAPLPTVQFNKEFLTFTAAEDDDSAEIEELVKLLQPKHFFVIEMPDMDDTADMADTAPDVLTLAEQKLESAKPLDVYVVRRAAYDDRQQQREHEPAVYFVN